MIYVWDTNALSVLFDHFYRSRFPSLWERFDPMVENGSITSTREVRREIEDSPVADLIEWSQNNPEVFVTPTADEGLVVRDIYAVEHFQQNIERKKLYKGGKNADPFLIARASVLDGTVVSREKRMPNAVRIPNICDHFGIDCMTLEEFMEEEGWQF